VRVLGIAFQQEKEIQSLFSMRESQLKNPMVQKLNLLGSRTVPWTA
jgi:hypothetical protein